MESGGMDGDRDGGEGSRRKTKLILLRWQNIINIVSEKPNRRGGGERDGEKIRIRATTEKNRKKRNNGGKMELSYRK